MPWVIELAASRLFVWASRKSPIWNIGFAVLLVTAAVAALVLALALETGGIPL